MVKELISVNMKYVYATNKTLVINLPMKLQHTSAGSNTLHSMAKICISSKALISCFMGENLKSIGLVGRHINKNINRSQDKSSGK